MSKRNEWELVTQDDVEDFCLETSRLAVPGGWIYMREVHQSEPESDVWKAITHSLVFVPDPTVSPPV